AVISGGGHVQRGYMTVFSCTDLDIHVVVAGESRACQILRARFDPLHRPTDLERTNDGTDISWIDGDFVTEPATEIRRDDVDLVFRDPGNERERRPIHVRRLRCDMELQPAHRVEVRDAPAWLERCRMTTLEPHALLDMPGTRRQGARRLVFVAHFPMEDVVRLL